MSSQKNWLLSIDLPAQYIVLYGSAVLLCPSEHASKPRISMQAQHGFGTMQAEGWL